MLSQETRIIKKNKHVVILNDNDPFIGRGFIGVPKSHPLFGKTLDTILPNLEETLVGIFDKLKKFLPPGLELLNQASPSMTDTFRRNVIDAIKSNSIMPMMIRFNYKKYVAESGTKLTEEEFLAKMKDTRGAFVVEMFSKHMNKLMTENVLTSEAAHAAAESSSELMLKLTNSAEILGNKLDFSDQVSLRDGSKIYLTYSNFQYWEDYFSCTTGIDQPSIFAENCNSEVIKLYDKLCARYDKLQKHYDEKTQTSIAAGALVSTASDSGYASDLDSGLLESLASKNPTFFAELEKFKASAIKSTEKILKHGTKATELLIKIESLIGVEEMKNYVHLYTSSSPHITSKQDPDYEFVKDMLISLKVNTEDDYWYFGYEYFKRTLVPSLTFEDMWEMNYMFEQQIRDWCAQHYAS